MQKLFIILSMVLIFGACKTQKMSKVDPVDMAEVSDEARPEVEVQTANTTDIRTMEEKISFTSDTDKDTHDQNQFFVIIGSFRDESNAQNYKETLIGKGFDPVILLSETGFHRVSVGSYPDELRARAIIYQIKTDFPEHNDTWLLIRR